MTNFPLDPIMINQLREITANILASRATTWSNWASELDPRRNLEQECGYPEGYVSPSTFYKLYRKDCIARRAIQVWADEGWNVAPEVYEDESNGKTTTFEKAWLDLPTNLDSPLPNYFRDEETNPVWEWLQRFDEMSGIGTYGVLLYGLDDGNALDKPVAGFQEVGSIPRAKGDGPSVLQANSPPRYEFTTNLAKIGRRRLLYLNVFPEAMAQISAYETNPTSPRYGMPTSYLLSLNDPDATQTSVGAPVGDFTVHWTRVQHLVIQQESSRTFGTPVLEPILSRVLDLRKIYGSSGEGYYRLGFPGISLETHPTLGGDVDISVSQTRSQLEQYMNGLQRYLIGMGMTAKTLPPSVTDPTQFVEKQLQAICMALDIPMRVFMGSERGELSSDQDDRRHKGKCRKRRTRLQSPRILAPFGNRLVAYGVLPKPDKAVRQKWPDQDTQTEAEKADVSVKKTQALVSYRASGADDIMSPLDYYAKVWDMSVEEAKAVLEDAKKFQSETGGLEPIEQGVSGLQTDGKGGKDPAGVGSLKGRTGIKNK